MQSAETSEQLWQQLDGLYQIVAELIEIQQTAVAAYQRSATTVQEQNETLLAPAPLLDQLDQLRERLAQQRTAAQQAAEQATGTAPVHVAELTVGRLNVTEPDGTLRLVLCNSQRSPGHVMDGKVYGEPEGKRWAGLYFFNEEGNECGGLIFNGKREADGSYQTGGSLTFDQYRQDQVICFQHGDGNGQRFAGLHIWDRPDLPLDEWGERFGSVRAMPAGPEKEAAIHQLRSAGQLPAQRLFVGKEPDKAATIRLHDGQGRVRLRLSLGEAGAPALELLDHVADHHLYHATCHGPGLLALQKPGPCAGIRAQVWQGAHLLS